MPQMDGLKDGKPEDVEGEEKAVTHELTSSWKETYLLANISRFNLKDIYNVDEFGLLYQALPSKKMELRRKKCVGGNNKGYFISCSFLLILQVHF